MNIEDLLPMPPDKGPPLPRVLNILWPWLQQGTAATSPNLPSIFTGPSETPAPTTTYDNIESIEFPEGFDPVTFMPKKIVVHRNATVTPAPK